MRPLRSALAIAACSILVAACSSNAVLPAPGSGTASAVSRGCAHFSRHQYEVCYAYLVNDSLLARVPYYKAGRDPVLGSLALTRLKSRYYGAARRAVIGQTRGWPRDVSVPVPSIRIVGPVRVSANLATATIHTVETWLVRARPANGGKSGRVLFSETNAHHTVTLDRTPTILCIAGHCLHKWVVVRIG
jgi:hypothetical protein